MDVYLNGSLNPSYKKIIFTGIPNILHIKDDEGDDFERLEITIDGDLFSSVTGNSQYHITINGDTIANTTDANNSINKNFYISASNNSTANSIVKALRACPRLASGYDVYQVGLSNTIWIKAKSAGAKGMTIESNIPSANLTSTLHQGATSSELTDAKIDVDVYESGNYVTTMEKSFYDSNVYFNVSPVISTFAEYGKAKPFQLVIYSNKNGVINELKTINDFETSIGYYANQGDSVLYYGGTQLAMNVARGSSKPTFNTMDLYVYDRIIPMSFYSKDEKEFKMKVKYLDSAKVEIHSETKTFNFQHGLNDIEVILDTTYMKNAFYIDLSLEQGTLRYNVIKPLRATEDYQRITWRNSYGGLSFFDFTGEKSETRSVDGTTYEKQIFDLYETSRKEKEILYSRDVDFEVTLKSHLLSKDGTHIFNDLIQSKYAYTSVNGETYNIIISGCEVTETDTNSIYEVTIKYKYSFPLNN